MSIYYEIEFAKLIIPYPAPLVMPCALCVVLVSVVSDASFSEPGYKEVFDTLVTWRCCIR